MATPKKKRSLERRRTRRAQQKITLPNLVKCTNCKNMRLSHKMCEVCGWYRGRCIIEPKVLNIES